MLNTLLGEEPENLSHHSWLRMLAYQSLLCVGRLLYW